MPVELSKRELRSHLKLKREEFLNSHNKESLCEQIASHLNDVLHNDVQTVASFSALSHEASPHLLQKLRPHLKWAYPKVIGESLEFYEVTDINTQMTPGALNVLEPNIELCNKVSLGDCEAVFVPGLGFDRESQRIGYGKGFYDRALSNFKGQKIGICFEIQIYNESLPTEAHDASMDFIVNEQYVMSSLKGQRKGN